jgi:alkylhydroperoxidase family enzyme
VSRLADAPELEPARVHASDALAALEAANAAARRAIDPELAELLQRRVDELLGIGAGTAAGASATDRERACFDFADQFVVFVPGVTVAQRAAVAAQLGPERVHELARMLYVFDLTARLRVALGRLFEPVTDTNGPEPCDVTSLESSLGSLHAAAMRLQSLDPVTTELVRLHCARYHDCKT